MPLSELQIKNAKPADKPYRMADGGGLYIEVSPAGGKLWRLKFRFNGKEKRLSLGAYPAVGLKAARTMREDARQLLAQGIDPAAHKQAQKASRSERAGNSFEVIAREWLETFSKERAESHHSKIKARLEKDVFPWLGSRPVAEITAPEVLAVLRRIESRGVSETARRARGNIGQVMRYAISTGRASRDPCPDLRGALPSPERKHFAAITDPKEAGELLRAIDGYTGTYTVRAALKLAPLLFARPGELRQMEWADIDLGVAEWKYIVSKTKTPHLVPLARQAVEVLTDLHPLTGQGRYVFPSPRTGDRAMSENAVLSALRRMAVPKEKMSGHGFRAMARTILAEHLHVKPEVIEHQLAHKVPDTLGTAYNRTKFLKERKEMMQHWADYLDRLRAGAEVIPLRGAGS